MNRGSVGLARRYVGIATATRPYFVASKDSPVEDFVAEADRHPVFEPTPVTNDRLPTITNPDRTNVANCGTRASQNGMTVRRLRVL